MSEGTPNLVIDLLGTDYLQKLGTYIQTCAHIEYVASEVVCLCENFHRGSDEWEDRYHKLRGSSTSQLIKALKKGAAKLDVKKEARSELSDLAERISTYVENRHLAVHGAHFINGPKLTIEAAKRESRNQFTELSLGEVDSLVDDANRILINLVRIREMLAHQSISTKNNIQIL